MAKLFNRAKMTTATTGSGTVTLGSASNGFQTFAAAGVSNGDVVQYVIEEGANFEIGVGSYSSTGTSLTRSPTESSNSNNAITLAGQATVSITAVADDLNRLQHGGSDKVTVSSTGASVTGNLAVSGTVDGRDVASDGSKLDGIESGATGDQTASEIRALVESASDSNVFTDADHSKLNGIEAGATGDQTNAEIRAAVEAATDSNVFTDADHSKLNGIEAGATGDQTNAEIRAAVEAATDSNVFTDADHTKLNGIEANATADQTITAGGGLTGGGTGNVTISHSDTSSQASVNGSGRTYIQDITLDTYGHVTGLATATETVVNTNTIPNNATITLSAGGALTGGGNFTTDQSANETITFNHSDTSSQGSVNNSGRTYIQDITLDGYGHVTGISSATETVVNTDTNTNQLTTFVVEDGDGTEVTISHGKEWKFVEAGGININWTDTSTGSDGDPFDLSFNVSTSITAGSGLTGGGALSSNRTISHSDTSTQASGNNSSGTVIQDVTLDGFGHVTGLASVNLDGRYYTESESDARFLRGNTDDQMDGTLTIQSGGTNSYGRIRGYNNDNHFIVIRGIVGTGTSNLSITGGHRTTFVEHAENNDTTGWYFVSKQTGSYQEIARITRTGGMHLQGNKVFHDGYHPNADKWTTARTLSLSGDASGSVSWDGSGNATLSVAVSNDSHTHDGRYYTESESNTRFAQKNTSTRQDFTGSIKVSSNNTTGGGIVLADDGDIVDLNDGYASMRFSNGVRVFSANGSGSVRHTLHSNGTFTSTGNINSQSDIRVKENIEPISDAMQKVQSINGVTFNRNDLDDTETRYVGVIAQDVEAVLPEAVSENGEGIKQVAYGNMVGLLIEAIKEQQTQIDDLKTEIQSMKS
jgi:hypothetical protein